MLLRVVLMRTDMADSLMGELSCLKFVEKFPYVKENIAVNITLHPFFPKLDCIDVAV